jgi:ribose-phosphate pyrophosphokinase
MNAAVFAFPESRESAGRLANWLGIPLHDVGTRRFPDNECLVRVPSAATVSIIYRSLDNLDPKLFELLLAASALRDLGAHRVILVAPYLAYMRQDMAFSLGEAVSQRVMGRLLAEHFDALVTVDPHLHRINKLAEAIPHIPALALSAAPALADSISAEDRPVLIGPDAEARPWVEAIAEPHALDMLVGNKQRHGDRDVTLAIDGIGRVAGRRVVLVDDIISSGGTFVQCARLVSAAGASRIEAAVTHCLATPTDLKRLRAVGIANLIATDTVPGSNSSVSVAWLIGKALINSGLLSGT